MACYSRTSPHEQFCVEFFTFHFHAMKNTKSVMKSEHSRLVFAAMCDQLAVAEKENTT